MLVSASTFETNCHNGVSGIPFLFQKVSSPVCSPPMSHLCQKTSNNYLFADSVHPTDMAHRTLYLEVENQIRLWATDFFL